jgi:hypothetical protein
MKVILKINNAGIERRPHSYRHTALESYKQEATDQYQSIPGIHSGAGVDTTKKALR